MTVFDHAPERRRDPGQAIREDEPLSRRMCLLVIAATSGLLWTLAISIYTLW